MHQNNYLHRDTLNGRDLTIAVNQPITAIESHGLTQAARLRKFMSVNRATYLLVQKDLAWCTERRAVIVGAQCLDWQLPDSRTLICWPLDNAVFFATLSSEGFNMIEAESEMINSFEDALEVLAACNTSVLILPGGTLAARLEAAGYPSNASDAQVLLDASRYRTRSSVLIFTQLRLPHPAHALVLLLLIGSGFSVHKLLSDRTGGDEQVMQILEPPQGRPSLVHELRAIRTAIQDLMVLTLHGLSRITYEADTRELHATGQVDFNKLIRMNEIAKKFNKTLKVIGKRWQLAYTLVPGEIGKQPLRPIDSEVARLVQPGSAAGFSVSIQEYQTGGPPLSLDQGFRLLSRDYIEAELLMTANSQRSLVALAQLLSHIASFEPLPNARLRRFSVEMSESGDLSLTLSILVRGQEPVYPEERQEDIQQKAAES